MVTDTEALERFIKAFGNNLPTFENTEYWEKITNGAKWYEKHYPESKANVLVQTYLRSMYELASIEFIVKKGGEELNEQLRKIR